MRAETARRRLTAEMTTIKVEASGSYEVKIGENLLSSCGAEARGLFPKAERCLIVSDTNVAPLYLEKVKSSLTDAGFGTIEYIIPAGEESKNGEMFLRILNFLAENKLTRTDFAVALGGGVVGDLTGFVSACYLRGIKFIQIPTTLLADVDSSVGGKTAIDLEAGKNLAGAFYQPSLVLCDYLTLNTLTPEVFSDGCAEVIKYGILGDTELFRHLENKGLNFDTEYVISRCIDAKRRVVMEDEFDTGARRFLNLGHTLGHAVEQRSAFTLSHGKSVAIGTAAVSNASAKAGIMPKSDAERIVKILREFNLPTDVPYDLNVLYPIMLSDKKRTGSTVNLIVPQEIGKCAVMPMNLNELREFFE